MVDSVTRDSCPSELAFDRLLLGELSSAEEEKLRAHAAACDDCGARLAEGDAGFAAFEGFDAGAMVDRLHANLAGVTPPPAIESLVRESAGEPPPARRPGPLVRLFGALRGGWVGGAVVGAAAAAVVLLVVRPWADTPNGPGSRGGPGLHGAETVRLKGGTALRVHRATQDGGSEELRSGAELGPETHQLRFEITIPTDGHVMVVDVDAAGTLAAAYPADGSNRSRSESAADRRVLPGAVRFAATGAEEWLHLVHCPAPFALGDLIASEPRDGLGLPEGCSSDGVLLRFTPAAGDGHK